MTPFGFQTVQEHSALDRSTVWQFENSMISYWALPDGLNETARSLPKHSVAK